MQIPSEPERQEHDRRELVFDFWQMPNSYGEAILKWYSSNEKTIREKFKIVYHHQNILDHLKLQDFTGSIPYNKFQALSEKVCDYIDKLGMDNELQKVKGKMENLSYQDMVDILGNGFEAVDILNMCFDKYTHNRPFINPFSIALEPNFNREYTRRYKPEEFYLATQMAIFCCVVAVSEYSSQLAVDSYNFVAMIKHYDSEAVSIIQDMQQWLDEPNSTGDTLINYVKDYFCRLFNYRKDEAYSSISTEIGTRVSDLFQELSMAVDSKHPEQVEIFTQIVSNNAEKSQALTFHQYNHRIVLFLDQIIHIMYPDVYNKYWENNQPFPTNQSKNNQMQKENCQYRIINKKDMLFEADKNIKKQNISNITQTGEVNFNTYSVVIRQKLEKAIKSPYIHINENSPKTKAFFQSWSKHFVNNFKIFLEDQANSAWIQISFYLPCRLNVKLHQIYLNEIKDRTKSFLANSTQHSRYSPYFSLLTNLVPLQDGVEESRLEGMLLQYVTFLQLSDQKFRKNSTSPHYFRRSPNILLEHFEIEDDFWHNAIQFPLTHKYIEHGSGLNVVYKKNKFDLKGKLKDYKTEKFYDPWKQLFITKEPQLWQDIKNLFQKWEYLAEQVVNLQKYYHSRSGYNFLPVHIIESINNEFIPDLEILYEGLENLTQRGKSILSLVNLVPKVEDCIRALQETLFPFFLLGTSKGLGIESPIDFKKITLTQSKPFSFNVTLPEQIIGYIPNQKIVTNFPDPKPLLKIESLVREAQYKSVGRTRTNESPTDNGDWVLWHEIPAGWNKNFRLENICHSIFKELCFKAASSQFLNTASMPINWGFVSSVAISTEKEISITQIGDVQVVLILQHKETGKISTIHLSGPFQQNLTNLEQKNNFPPCLQVSPEGVCLRNFLGVNTPSVAIMNNEPYFTGIPDVIYINIDDLCRAFNKSNSSDFHQYLLMYSDGINAHCDFEAKYEFNQLVHGLRSLSFKGIRQSVYELALKEEKK